MSNLIDFTEIDPDGEVWELFARDFLKELGFFIESTPDRGADGGKDLLISEQLEGHLNKYRFKWLVSCKHNAKSKKSVKEEDEINIQERVESFGADGFIGFYSTLPSSGLNTRLNNLKEKNKVKDYQIFDSKLIENYLIRIGFSKLLMRYLPNSYKRVKPLHLITSKYLPIKCDHCEKDLLESLHSESYSGVTCHVVQLGSNEILDVYWACKGDCDKYLESKYLQLYDNAITRWEDISDLEIPILFMQWIFTIMNLLRSGETKYTDQAFEKEKSFILAMGQKVLREMTEDEKKRADTILSLPPYL